ncbi:MAG: HAMP domain-containing sensor histidine kinase [Cytophagales bacterium]|nr:HAMP domain-containing histidine kinase [Bernardetiaceae bacterium]MDW8210020.1 HAMP domain-containing sensor histidine kinase [Cytophagales bacterium]
MQRKTIRRLIVLAILSAIGITTTQIYWVSSAFDLKEKQLNQRIHVALQTVAEQIAAYNKSTLPNDNVVNQLSSDYFIVNVNDVIDVNVLDLYLRREFSRVNLQLDFEYGIYDCSTDKMIYGKYVKAGGDIKETNNKKELPKYDKFIYYFGVSFPQKTQYMLYDMRLWIFSSVLILALMGFFAYALYVILAQRRLAEIQKDFVDNMTHEFQTPIATINIAADVLLSPDIVKQPERLARYAYIVKKEAQRLQKHVESILQAIRSEKIGLTLQKEPLDLVELVQETINYFQMQLKEKNVQVLWHLQVPPQEIIVSADASHLTNLLINLLDNAVKYGGNPPEITVKVSLQNQQASVRVADNGMGIPEKYRKKIFEKFYRIPTGNLHHSKGFGLGLHYVRNIVKAHGWQLHLTCPAQGGSIFEISMPAEAINQSPQQVSTYDNRANFVCRR